MSAGERPRPAVYGLSVHLPFGGNAVRERLGLEYGLGGGADREVIGECGVSMDQGACGLADVAGHVRPEATPTGASPTTGRVWTTSGRCSST